jgi:hypothetical protein
MSVKIDEIVYSLNYNIGDSHWEQVDPYRNNAMSSKIPVEDIIIKEYKIIGILIYKHYFKTRPQHYLMYVINKAPELKTNKLEDGNYLVKYREVYPQDICPTKKDWINKIKKEREFLKNI